MPTFQSTGMCSPFQKCKYDEKVNVCKFNKLLKGYKLKKNVKKRLGEAVIFVKLKKMFQ